MPSSYDLYAALGLDRDRTSEQLAADLDHRLEGVTRETPQWHELSAARAVLGDPTRRQMYDQRLGDPSQTVTPVEIQQLAAMNVGATTGGTSTGGGLGGVIKRNPKLSATAGVLAVAVLAVGGLAIGGAISGGDDDDTSSASASGSSSSTTESSGSYDGSDDSREVILAKAEFGLTEFLDEDEVVTVDTVVDDDDPSKTYPSHTFSFGNLRTISDGTDTYACFDLTGESLVTPSDKDKREYQSIYNPQYHSEVTDQDLALYAAQQASDDYHLRIKSIRDDGDREYFRGRVTTEYAVTTGGPADTVDAIGADWAKEYDTIGDRYGDKVRTNGLKFTATQCVGIANGVEPGSGELPGIAVDLRGTGISNQGDHANDAEYARLNF